MANIFQSALFKKPQYSKFDLSHDWKGSYEIGELIPTYWRFVHPGERFIARAEQLTRFAPMLAPVMHQFDVTIDWHFCPLRLLNVGSEDFFNMQKNADYSKTLPSVPLGYFLNTPAHSDTLGTLIDYFGYPTLDNLPHGFVSLYDRDLYSSTSFYKEIESTSSKIVPTLRGFCHYLVFVTKSGSIKNFENWKTLVYPAYKDRQVSGMEYYDGLKYLGLNEVQLIDKYLKFCKDKFFIKENTDFSNHEGPNVSLLPFYAYWRIVSDWYVNPNFTDCDKFFLDRWHYLQNYQKASEHQESSLTLLDKFLYTPYLRNYASDYFTTAFLDTQVGNAVSIPTNGTIVDLRQANSIQKLRERALYAGKRYIDSVLAFFGVKSSDVRLDRSEVLARDTYKVNISAVTQTNQSDIDNMLDTPLGTYAGEGFAAGGRGKFDYTAEEHGIIMCMVSVRPKASYMQGVNPLLTKSKVTDFIIPDLAQIGEQSIPMCHLFCDWDVLNDELDIDGTFGYTRRYAEFMFSLSETHGDFRTSLNFWHATRMFDSMPIAGDAFCQIMVDRDNTNRIFAVPDSVDHVYQYLYFDIDCISPLPRYVHYDL